MNKRFFALIILVLTILAVQFKANSVLASSMPQISTPIVPTVTNVVSGPFVTVRPGQSETFIKVRSGPNAAVFPQIGILSIGQQARAKGITAGGDWILIEYPGVPGGEGWVYSGYVSITPGDLPFVEPVPTPTPVVTQTIDPTLAAQFMVTNEPARLPTFTQAPPLALPTYTSETSSSNIAGVPIGLIIVLLGALGIIVGFIAILSQR